MSSPPHRAIVLSHTFREVGFGLSRGAPRPGYPDAVTVASSYGYIAR